MARMLPAQVSEHISSKAELRLFATLREGLDDDWTVLHSLGIAGHPRKPWAEIDFVLVGPPGIICLEVKGGRVRRRGGRWYFIDGSGEPHEKREGPFEQVGSASAALYTWLRDHVEGIRSRFVGYAVATPDGPWVVKGPDIVPELVYDSSDGEQAISRFIDRVVAYWQASMEDRFGRPAEPLDERFRLEVVEALRGDFDLRPSLRARVRNIGADLLELTHEQYRVLDGLVDSSRAIIRGGAGTGKTLLAVEETFRAAKAGKRVALVCSSARLGDYLRVAVDDDRVVVRHLHGLMADVVRRSGRTSNLPDASPMDLFTLFYPEQTMEGLADLGELGSFDMLVVDEAQDLLHPAYLDVFDGMLDGGLRNGAWRMFVDPIQNIFDVMHTAGLRRVTEHRPAQFRLTVNCRNTEQIAIHTSLLADVEVAPVLRVEGDDVDIVWYTDAADQRRKVGHLINRLLSGGLGPGDIVVLGPSALGSSSVAGGLDEIPYGLHDLGSASRPDRALGYSTIAGFKGLEADAIVIVDVANLLQPRERGGLYVATSRARALLSVFIAESAKDDYQELARRLGERFTT